MLCVLLIIFINRFGLYEATATLAIPDAVVSVLETEQNRIQLTPPSRPIQCSDTDGDLTRGYVQSVNPSAPCGRCFSMMPCGNSAKEFCLEYFPTQGSLIFKQVSSYAIMITCTDDKDPAVTSSIEVRVIANKPPRFSSATLYESVTVDFTLDKRKGDVIYQVQAVDDEGDAIFYTMTMSPNSDNFEIGYTSGTIRAAVDMRIQCENFIAFYVSIFDLQNPVVGPKVIYVDFLKYNNAPLFRSTFKTVSVAEDKAVDFVVATLDVIDNDIYPNLTLSMITDPPKGLDLYKLSGKQIQVRKALDYEYKDLREVKVSLKAFDGFCFSVYTLNITITNVNEPLVLRPLLLQPTYFEGFVTYVPNVTIVDPDENEVFTFRKKSGASNLLVKSTNGLVTSDSDVDIDPKDTKSFSIFMEVSDSAGHVAVTEVNVTLQDYNDNIPAFKATQYDFNVDNCTSLGNVVGTVLASDGDSALYGNNVLVFNGSGTHFYVMTDGSVVYTALMAVDDVDAGSAYVRDLGQYPGPLEGTPVVVTLTCKLCPTPPQTTTQAGQTTTISASGSGTGSGVGFGINTTASNDVTFASRNVAWLSVAGVAFATFVTLLPFLVWRHACGSGKGPCGKGKTTTEYETLRTRTGANASDKIQKSPGNSTKTSLKKQQPRQNNQPSKQPQKSLSKAETNTKQPRSEISNQPRSEIPAIAAISTEPLMVPPHLPYPEYFVQSAPADLFTQKSDLVKQKGAKTNYTSKAKAQKTSSKEDDKAEGQNVQATPRRPKMDIGEEFDLQILTPR